MILMQYERLKDAYKAKRRVPSDTSTVLDKEATFNPFHKMLKYASDAAESLITWKCQRGFRDLDYDTAVFICYCDNGS